MYVRGRDNRDDRPRRDPDGKPRALAQALTRIVVETVYARLATRDSSRDRGRDDAQGDDRNGSHDGNVPSGDLEGDVYTATDREEYHRRDDAMDGGRLRRNPHQTDTLVAASMDALDAYLATPEARALCPVTSCLCGRNFETFVRDIVYDMLERHTPNTP